MGQGKGQMGPIRRFALDNGHPYSAADPCIGRPRDGEW
jgi:hypothetical protein